MPHEEYRFSEQPDGDRAHSREEDGSWDADPERRLEEKLQCIRRGKLSWIDREFRDTPVLLLWLFCLGCSPAALVAGMIGLYACALPEARRKALGTTVAAGIVLSCCGWSKAIDGLVELLK